VTAPHEERQFLRRAWSRNGAGNGEMIAGPVAAEARHILIAVDKEIGGKTLEQRFEIMAVAAGGDVHFIFPSKPELSG
jgi:hypothetical protein